MCEFTLQIDYKIEKFRAFGAFQGLFIFLELSASDFFWVRSFFFGNPSQMGGVRVLTGGRLFLIARYRKSAKIDFREKW